MLKSRRGRAARPQLGAQIDRVSCDRAAKRLGVGVGRGLNDYIDGLRALRRDIDRGLQFLDASLGQQVAITDIIDADRATRLEATIVMLIVAELVVRLYQIYAGGRH